MEKKLTGIVDVVERRLQELFDSYVNPRTGHLFSPPVNLDIFGEIESLTMRGGKRIRAALVCAGYELFRPEGIKRMEVVDTAAAMELYQSYLLIHDDIMDDDDTRRGGPSVHASLARLKDSRKLGYDLGILAGDMANSLAERTLLGLDCEPALTLGVMDVFNGMILDVVAGQCLDVEGESSPEEIVTRKTASYTTVGPLCAGAVLSGAGPEEINAVRAIGTPLGLAFQYQDDIIGMFGDPAKTGKPVGTDLRNGKNTWLLSAAISAASESQRSLIHRVIGGACGDDEISAALEAIEETGARDSCEQMVRELTGEVERLLDDGDYLSEGREFLGWLNQLLAGRVK